MIPKWLAKNVSKSESQKAVCAWKLIWLFGLYGWYVLYPVSISELMYTEDEASKHWSFLCNNLA